MSEYSLMGKYSLVGFFTIMLYDMIGKKYVEKDNL